MHLIAFLFSCSENKLARHTDIDAVYDFPTIDVAPGAYDFGALSSGESGETVVTITNVGTIGSELTLGDIALTVGGDAGFTLVDVPTDTVLRHNETAEFMVTFVPTAPVSAYGLIEVHSDDETNPVVHVELTGEGIMPQLVISPDPLAYDETVVGCEREAQFVLRNAGNDDLELTAMASEGTGFVMRERPTLPAVLAPDEEALVRMAFAPGMPDDFAGTLYVESNDPRGPLRAAQTGTSIAPGTYVEHEVVPTAGAIDLLFMVDKSNSMADEQSLLAAQASAFGIALNAVTDDWRVMVVTKDDGCNSGGIMSPDTVGFPAKFTAAVLEGSEGSPGWGVYTEALTYLAGLAVAETDARECNAGFLRPEALLHVIYVTDEYDQSDELEHVPWYVTLEDMRARKGADYLVKMSAVAGDVPSGCDSVENHAGPAFGYADAVAATHGGFLSICSAWSAEVDTVAAYGISRDTFPLGHRPDAATIAVNVNGAWRSSGWHYMSDRNSIVFTEDVPESGDTVEWSYTVPVVCE